jgi:hypothetical protein
MLSGANYFPLTGFAETCQLWAEYEHFSNFRHLHSFDKGCKDFNNPF